MTTSGTTPLRCAAGGQDYCVSDVVRCYVMPAAQALSTG